MMWRFIFQTQVWGLLGYHSYLVATGQTTWEHWTEVVGEATYSADTVGENIAAFSRRSAISDTAVFRWRSRLREREFNFFDNEYYSCC